MDVQDLFLGKRFGELGGEGLEGFQYACFPVYQGAVDVEGEKLVICEFGHCDGANREGCGMMKKCVLSVVSGHS